MQRKMQYKCLSDKKTLPNIYHLFDKLVLQQMLHIYLQNSGKSCLSFWSYRHPEFFIFEPEIHCRQKSYF